MKIKAPFGKNDHIRMIKEIAIGLQKACQLNRYLEIGIKKGNCFLCMNCGSNNGACG